MLFTSTRDRSLSVKFSQAVLDCMPPDGGLFVPSSIEDLRRWIYYIDGDTSFTSIAGTLTSAFIKDEFSPIICERIATSAFPFEPSVRQLDDNLFMLQLYHGYTGCQRDFGVSYLCSYLETTLEMSSQKAVILDFTHGGLGSLLARVLHGKKNIKAVLLYEKGTVRGINDEDLSANGGNICPLETELDEAGCRRIIGEVFADREFVRRNGLTVANTSNVCRLMAQVFFFPYSFSRIKSLVSGDIYYALEAGNYGTIMAGLYSWRFALPLSGFFLPATDALSADAAGNPILLDSFVDIKKRNRSDPSLPANLERLEAFFEKNSMMMRNFVFPNRISVAETDEAAKELFRKYGIFADRNTAGAYAVIKKNSGAVNDEDGSFVLVAHNHPALSAEYCRHTTGEMPEIPDNIKETMVPAVSGRPLVSTSGEIRSAVEEICGSR